MQFTVKWKKNRWNVKGADKEHNEMSKNKKKMASGAGGKRERKKNGQSSLEKFNSQWKFSFGMWFSFSQPLWNHKHCIEYAHEEISTRKQIEQSINWFDYYIEPLMCSDFVCINLIGTDEGKIIWSIHLHNWDRRIREKNTHTHHTQCRLFALHIFASISLG